MNDAEFGKWFAETGCRWKGWPEWDGANIYGKWRERLCFDGFKWRIQWKGCRPHDWEDAYVISEHIAACLMRDFIISYLAQTVQTDGSTDVFNRELVKEVEAQMKEEADAIRKP